VLARGLEGFCRCCGEESFTFAVSRLVIPVCEKLLCGEVRLLEFPWVFPHLDSVMDSVLLDAAVLALGVCVLHSRGLL